MCGCTFTSFDLTNSGPSVGIFCLSSRRKSQINKAIDAVFSKTRALKFLDSSIKCMKTDNYIILLNLVYIRKKYNFGHNWRLALPWKPRKKKTTRELDNCFNASSGTTEQRAAVKWLQGRRAVYVNRTGLDQTLISGADISAGDLSLLKNETDTNPFSNFDFSGKADQ